MNNQIRLILNYDNLIFPQDFINTIICGDALHLITKIPDNSIDVIFTDPPYGLNKQDIINDNNLQTFYLILPQCYRVLKKDSFFITFFSTKFLPQLFQNNPFKYFWQFILYCPASSVRSPIGFTKYMSCFVFTKGNPQPIHFSKDTFTDASGKFIEPDEGYIDHPTPKPKKFIKQILHIFTTEQSLILDPFAGSGSIPLTCFLLNRKFIAFEIEQKYCHLSYSRIKNFQFIRQQTIFSKS